MTVIKRDKKASTSDLVSALGSFAVLLEEQKEQDAAADLKKLASTLSHTTPDSDELCKTAQAILNAFEEHELGVYMQARVNTDQWTKADELLEASSRVMNLAKRLVK